MKPAMPKLPAPDEIVRFTKVEQVVRTGVESLKAREENEKVWLDYARDKWRLGKETSERGGAVEMDDVQLSRFCDKIIEELRP
jgi:hypothetical protein